MLRELAVGKTSPSNAQAKNWTGRYYGEAHNRDGLKTSFDIRIVDLKQISVIHVSDGESPETYKNLSAEVIAPDKIKIVFNPKYGNMGFVYLEREGKTYQLSGEAVSFINPGNETLPLLLQ